MAFVLFYNGEDSQVIEDSYQAARTRMASADRQNVDACWNGGLSTWNTTAVRVYTPATAVWHAACYRGGVLDTGLCDADTRLIVVSGIWAANAAAYGAVRNAAITKTVFVALVGRMATADPDSARAAAIRALAGDIAATAVEPWP